MRLEAWNGGNQRTNPGGDPNGDHKHIVKHQCRAGEQTCKCAEILRCNRVRSSSSRIGGDCLAVRKINNAEKHDDTGADWNDLSDAEGAQRNEKCESGFRSVSRRAERIEPEDWNSGGRPNFLGPLIRGSKRLAEQNIQKGHAPSHRHGMGLD